MVYSHLPWEWEENYCLCSGKERTLISHPLKVYLTAGRAREKGPAQGIIETDS